jgi:DNA (cytosine-5)-methyltransferase 1
MLVLSLFPGIGLLDMAFEQEGFCVVRGPDLLWGGDVRRFHPPAGKFDGVIGGPPCQFASEMSRLNVATGNAIAENLIPEFERCIGEARPRWFVMENVVDAPSAYVDGYHCIGEIVRDVWCGGETMRKRRFTYGQRGARRNTFRFQIETLALHRPDPAVAITSCARVDGGQVRVVNGKKRRCGTGGPRLPIAQMAERQGLPASFFGDASPFTAEAQRKMLGNGVPLAMGRAVAKAVRAAASEGKRGET